MCKKREIVLEQAFKRLDIGQSGFIAVNDLKYWYKLNKFNHYDEEKIEEVFLFYIKILLLSFTMELISSLFDSKIILLWMSNFSFKNENKSQITREQFFDYYYVVSSTVIHDAYFDLLIRNTFHI